MYQPSNSIYLQSLRGLTKSKQLFDPRTNHLSKKKPCLAGLYKKSFQASADSGDRDKPFGNLAQIQHHFCMCCSDYACKSAQHNFFVLSALCAGHSFVHDTEELSSSILRMLIQVPVPWLKSRCGSQCSELNVLVAVATKIIM